MFIRNGIMFFEGKLNRAVKPHKCSECGTTIAKGDLYWLLACKGDGWRVLKNCLDHEVPDEYTRHRPKYKF